MVSSLPASTNSPPMNAPVCSRDLSVRRGETASSATASEEEKRRRERGDKKPRVVVVFLKIVADVATSIPEIERPLQSRRAPAAPNAADAFPRVMLVAVVSRNERTAREEKRRASMVRSFQAKK